MADIPDSRQRLIDATIEVITEKGESAVRLAEIAEAVGIKQPSIYYFFPSREDLVVAAHRERFRRAVVDVIDTLDTHVAGVATREEFVQSAIRGLGFALSDERADQRATRVSLFAKAATNPELLREINDSSFEATTRFASILEHAQQRGWIRNDVPAMTLAIWVRSLIFGRFLLEVDRTRYDGNEWTRLTTAAIEATLLGNLDPS